jgi:hypothetical protein
VAILLPLLRHIADATAVTQPQDHGHQRPECHHRHHHWRHWQLQELPVELKSSKLMTLAKLAVAKLKQAKLKQAPLA